MTERMCGNDLHEMTEENTTNSGRCRACRAAAGVNRYSPERRRITGQLRCDRNHPNTPRDPAPNGRCNRCRQLGVYRSIAKRDGAPVCDNGHGLVHGGVAPDGSCTECVPGAVPPAATWLDWAAVHQALAGLPLVRHLTNYEMLCALTTLRRRNAWDRTAASDWMRANTAIPVPDDNLEYIELVWARRHQLPALTVTEAITHGYEDCDEFEDIAA